jgi:hypothetical protein
VIDLEAIGADTADEEGLRFQRVRSIVDRGGFYVWLPDGET